MHEGGRDSATILRDRARALAGPGQDTALAGPSLELLEFRLAQECYALETRHVDEVVAFKHLTTLPGTPPFLLGIVDVRGRVVPVMDIRRLFDLPDHGLTDLHRIILVRGRALEVGVLADAVTGLRHFPLAGLQTSLPTLAGIRSDYLMGVVDSRVAILDMDAILTDPRIIVNEGAEE